MANKTAPGKQMTTRHWRPSSHRLFRWFQVALDWLEPSVTRRARASGTYENAYALLVAICPPRTGRAWSRTFRHRPVFRYQSALMVRFGLWWSIHDPCSLLYHPPHK